eukprot:scaffold792_cov84-Cylindrotheca_fusiformis.AAC.9
MSVQPTNDLFACPVPHTLTTQFLTISAVLHNNAPKTENNQQTMRYRNDKNRKSQPSAVVVVDGC